MILVHKSEGRLFLTDRNGFYNDLLKESNEITIGFTIIILTNNRSKLLPNSLITDDINIAATKGDQPLLKKYSEKDQIQVWNKNGPQNDFQSLMLGYKVLASLYRQNKKDENEEDTDSLMKNQEPSKQRIKELELIFKR